MKGWRRKRGPNKRNVNDRPRYLRSIQSFELLCVLIRPLRSSLISRDVFRHTENAFSAINSQRLTSKVPTTVHRKYYRWIPPPQLLKNDYCRHYESFRSFLFKGKIYFESEGNWSMRGIYFFLMITENVVNKRIRFLRESTFGTHWRVFKNVRCESR